MQKKIKLLLAVSLAFFPFQRAFAQCAASLGGDPPTTQVVDCLKQLEKQIESLKTAPKPGFSLLAGGIVDDDGAQVSHFGPIDFVPVQETELVSTSHFTSEGKTPSYHYRIKLTAPLPSTLPLILVGAISPNGVVTPFVVESKNPKEFFVYVEGTLHQPNFVDTEHAYVRSAFWFLVLGVEQIK